MKLARGPILAPISLLLVIALTACSTRRPVRLEVPNADSPNPRLMASILKEGDRIRVTTLDGHYLVGSVVRFDDRYLTMILLASNDELSVRASKRYAMRNSLVVPWDDLTEIEYVDRSGAGVSIAGFSVGIAVGALIILYAIGQAFGDMTIGGR